LARSRWTERLLACALLLALAPAASADGPEGGAVRLSFARHGEALGERDLAALRAAAAAGTVRVFEPYEGREVVFGALPFGALLDAVYGEGWRKQEEILFTCSDGYQPTVPVQRVIEHRAWLAFERRDQPGFTVLKRESGETRTIELGPFYLVWENLDDAQMRQESDYGWPYQLVGIDLIDARQRFPGLAPPADAPPEVQAGFRAFRVHCSKCHQLNGEGGSIGPPLVAGASLEVRDRDWLRAWIEDPASIREDARMPALNPALPDRARTVDAILAYLETMLDAR